MNNSVLAFWGPWLPWEACSVECNGVDSVQTRERNCVLYEPHGDCEGNPPIEQHPCGREACTDRGMNSLIHYIIEKDN